MLSKGRTLTIIAITFTLVAPSVAFADVIFPDFSSSCGCDRDCAVFGSAYRCNNNVCTVGGTGTACTDGTVPDASGEPIGDYDAVPPGLDNLPGPDAPAASDGGATKDAGSTKKDDGGGCNVAPSSEGFGASALLSLLFGAALALARRRRRRAPRHR
ncbi:MAG: hypothetical protein KC503_23330 [Myxococcales bacterium]|nr:hypothetical protein [Myxococcales bacterium]